MNSTVQFCDSRLPANSIYRYLYEHGRRLFPDEAFADLFVRPWEEIASRRKS